MQSIFLTLSAFLQEVIKFLFKVNIFLSFMISIGPGTGNAAIGTPMLNASIHSYLILALAKKNDVTLDVGFYYMANAMGRLLGCIISGFSYQIAGLIGCFVFAGIFLFFCSVFSFYLKSY